MSYTIATTSDGKTVHICEDVDLSKETCSPELWAYLHAPDEERKLSKGERHELYN